MNSNTQVFFDFTVALRTLLRSPPRVNFTEELSTLPTHILDDASKLPEGSIKHMFAKHPFSTGAIVQVFHEDHIATITKSMGLLKVEILSRVVDFMVKSCNFKTLFLVIVRPLLFPRQSALQHFQPTLQLFKKLRWPYENTITGCQELFQTNINPNGMTLWHGVGNADITLQGDRCIPSVSLPQDSYLLDHKSCWNMSMQVNWNYSNFGQFDVQVRYGILFKLRKQQRLELTKLLESRKTKSSLLKVFPTSMQLLNSLLKDLGRNFAQSSKFFLSFWQVVKLLNFTGKFQFRREDVLFLKGASMLPSTYDCHTNP
jgi:hypothetical protein